MDDLGIWWYPHVRKPPEKSYCKSSAKKWDQLNQMAIQQNELDP